MVMFTSATKAYALQNPTQASALNRRFGSHRPVFPVQRSSAPGLPRRYIWRDIRTIATAVTAGGDSSAPVRRLSRTRFFRQCAIWLMPVVFCSSVPRFRAIQYLNDDPWYARYHFPLDGERFESRAMGRRGKTGWRHRHPGG